MKLNVQVESEEVKVAFEKICACEYCQDTGEINFDERDPDSHQFAPTGVEKCPMCKPDPEPYE